MTPRPPKAILITSLCLAAAQASLASWAPIPLKQVATENQVIVVGKIETIEPGKPKGARVMDTAFITVARILKNTLTDRPIAVGDQLPLGMPGKDGPRTSKDIRYTLGQEGIWLLELKGETFHATFPADFQKLDKLEEIKGYIKAVATPTFDEWVASGKPIPAGRIFIGGSPWFDESTGKQRSPAAVYRMLFGE